MTEVAEAQEFISQCSEATLNTDPIFSLFKKQDIEASLAASATGKYADFWTVDRLAEFNNCVDAAKDCPPEVKAIFSGSKNPRLRASKIGNLILNHARDLKQSGGLSAAPQSPGVSHTQTYAAEDAVATPRPASNAQATPLGGDQAQPQQQSPQRHTQLQQQSAGGVGDDLKDGPALLRLPAMQRYEFHPNLPQDCQLRVRGGPTSEAETLGVVTRADEIYATAVCGDWIQVELPGSGFTGEAWMMRQMEQTPLLIPSADPPLNASGFQPSADNTTNFDPLQSSIRSQTSTRSSTRQISRSDLVAANLSNTGGPRLSATVSGNATTASALGQNALATSQISSSDMPQTVSYAAYQMLEMRVSRLENELANALAKLRSI